MGVKKEPIKFTFNGEVLIGKICTRCEILKEFKDYPRNNQKTDGYNSYCKECKKVNDKKFYEENRDSIAARANSYYHERMKDHNFVLSERNRSKEKHQKYGEKYNKYYRNKYKNDADFLTAKKIRDKEWRLKNKDKIRLKSAKRRWVIKNLKSTLTTEEWHSTLTYFGGRCALTGDSENVTVEHFIPLAIGHGGHYKGNVYPLKSSLNLSKSVQNPFEWILRKDITSIISEERWYKLVEFLAKQNKLTVEEFKHYVHWCFENKREVTEKHCYLEESLAEWRREFSGQC